VAEGVFACRVPDACMSTSVGFMVGVQVVFGVVVSLVFRPSIPVITKLVLGSTAMEPPEAHIHHFGPAGNNCFREICPKTITLFFCKLMINHQTCSTPITSPKQKKMLHSMTSPIKRNLVTSPKKTNHPNTSFW
jgi:hypothetical protein